MVTLDWVWGHAWWGHGNTGPWGHGGDMATLDCGDMMGTWQHWTVGTWWGHRNSGLYMAILAHMLFAK